MVLRNWQPPPRPTAGLKMVKLFIGNLPREATEQEIRSLFEQYGKVLECDIIKNYGFVHIEDKTAAEDAIRNLHHHKLHGVCINVEASKNKSKASTKLHVGNISPTCTNLELRAKFEEYGPVIECDIVKDYAFVHMERAEDAVEAIRGLDNTEFQGDTTRGGALGWERESRCQVGRRRLGSSPRRDALERMGASCGALWGGGVVDVEWCSGVFVPNLGCFGGFTAEIWGVLVLLFLKPERFGGQVTKSRALWCLCV